MTRFTDGFPGSASHRISLFPTVACADLQEDMHCSCQKRQAVSIFPKDLGRNPCRQSPKPAERRHLLFYQ